MKRTLSLGLMVIFGAGALSARSATIVCPPMPEAVTQVTRNINSDVHAKVGSWGKMNAGEVSAKTEVEAKNLFDKYPNVDKLFTMQTLSATYCNMLNSATTMSDVEKVNRWERFMDKANALQTGAPPPAVIRDQPKPPPAKPKPATNLLGSWAGSAACVVVFTKDDGTHVEGSCDTPGHTHKMYGTYQTPTRIALTITRTDPTGCVTNVDGFINVINPNSVEVGQGGWHGCNVTTESVTTVLSRK